MTIHGVTRTMIAGMIALLLRTSDALAAEAGSKGLTLLLADSTQTRTNNFASIHKYALVVGVNEYQNKAQGITPLRFAVGDAEAVYQALVDPARGGFDPQNVTLLTDDSSEKPTNTAVGRALNQLITRAQSNDLVLVFFSGHGYEEGGRAYLLPANADLDALDYSAIERDAFVRQIDRIPANKVIVVLDACHSGGVSRGGKGAGRDLALSEKYYQSFTGAEGRAFIASCAGGELSWEDEAAKHGVFSSSLVAALSGQADTQPADGIITLDEVRRYLETQVSDWAGRRGKSQHPQINLESARGDMPIAINYSYLEAQSQTLTEHRDESARLRSGLAAVEHLEPSELADALEVVNKYGRAVPLTGGESQRFEFARKLVDGAITLEMYRSGVRREAPTTLDASRIGLGSKPRSVLANRWLWGGAGVAAVGTTLLLLSKGKSTVAPPGQSLLPAPPSPPTP